MSDEASEIDLVFGGHAPQEFANLPPDRRTLLKKTLFQLTPIRVGATRGEDYRLNPETGYRALRERYHGCSEDLSQQLLREARAVYYGENTFEVPLQWLPAFMTESLIDPETPEDIVPFVRLAVNFTIDLQAVPHLASRSDYDVLRNKAAHHGSNIPLDIEDEGSVHYRHGISMTSIWMQELLQNVFQFTITENMGLILQGRGPVDGSDLQTHQALKDLSYVVKLLRERFGKRFDVSKVVRKGPYGEHHPMIYPLDSYWDPPSEEAKKLVNAGEGATFEQVVQVEMQEWTRILPKD